MTIRKAQELIAEGAPDDFLTITLQTLILDEEMEFIEGIEVDSTEDRGALAERITENYEAQIASWNSF